MSQLVELKGSGVICENMAFKWTIQGAPLWLFMLKSQLVLNYVFEIMF